MRQTIIPCLIALALVVLTYGAEDKKPEDKIKDLESQVRLLKIENSGLRMTLIKLQGDKALDDLQSQQQADRAVICKEAGIELANCKIDVNQPVGRQVIDTSKEVKAELKPDPPAK